MHTIERVDQTQTWQVVFQQSGVQPYAITGPLQLQKAAAIASFLNGGEDPIELYAEDGPGSALERPHVAEPPRPKPTWSERDTQMLERLQKDLENAQLTHLHGMYKAFMAINNFPRHDLVARVWKRHLDAHQVEHLEKKFTEFAYNLVPFFLSLDRHRQIDLLLFINSHYNSRQRDEFAADLKAHGGGVPVKYPAG